MILAKTCLEQNTMCKSGDRKETDLRFAAGHVLGAQQFVYFSQTAFAVDYLRNVTHINFPKR